MKYTLKNPLVMDDLVLKGRDKLKLGRKLKVTKNGHLFELESINAGKQPSHLEGVERSEIHEFSSQSRARLIREVSSYGSMVPIFVTLTYGAEYPEPLETKKHLKAWWRRISSAHPDYFAVWKLEFQKRGAPHYHLLVYSKKGRPRICKDFLKESWWQATKTKNLRTEVKRLRSHRGGVWYATKYLAKTEVYKPPVDPSETGNARQSVPGPGRFWGIMSRKNKPDNVSHYMLSPTEYKLLLSEILNHLASSILTQELSKVNGIKYHEAKSLVSEDMIAEKAAELVRKSRVPVHLLSDEVGLISRISKLAEVSDKYGVSVMDDYFKDL